jgi:lysophospholipase L1-like esterase
LVVGGFVALVGCGGDDVAGTSGTAGTSATAGSISNSGGSNATVGTTSSGGSGGAGGTTNGESGASGGTAGNGGSADGSRPDSGMSVVDARAEDGAATDAIDLNGYNPCPPAGTPCAVMPLGDSITVGLGAWTGYRGPMFSLTLKGAKKMVYVGSQLDGPDTVDNVPFPRAHEGHGGFTIDGGGQREGIKALMVNVMTQYKPNIITMMIGTNDVQTHVTDIPTHYAGLVDLILSTDPKVLLVAAQVIPTGTDSNNVLIQALNASIRDIVLQRAAAGKHITLVDMYTPFVATPNFKTQLLVDDLHPKFDGYVIMANTYYGVVGPLLR